MAKQLTVRGVDPALERKLREVARQRGTSVNQALLLLLRQAVGTAPSDVDERQAEARHTDLDHLSGTWTEVEARAFDESLAQERRIDRELWP
jgi:hypothetical protein